MTEPKKYVRWLGLVAVSLGVFMSLLDVTVVNVALPTIQRSFNASFDNLQWVINAYTMVYAVVLLLMSKLGDMYGRKRIFLLSMFIFTIASALDASANSMLMLNFFRGVQAIGGAGMMSLSMAITASTFQGKERGVAMGVLGSIIGVSTAMGPLIGGALVQVFSWRAIFFINIPVGIIAFIMTLVYVHEGKTWGSKGGIDWIGIILSGLTVFGIIFGLIQKESHTDWGWLDWRIAGYIIMAIFALILFILWERKTKAPMMDLNIFKHPTFTGAVIAAFMLGAGLYSFYAYLTILMQNYIGYSALQTGTRQLLISGFSLGLGPVAGILSNYIAKRWLIGGSLLVIAAGMLVLLLDIHVGMSFATFWPAFILIGVGGAIINPPMNSAAMDSVEPYQLGMASGILNVLRQFGVSFGVVLLGLRLTDGYRASLDGALPKLSMPSQVATGLHHALFEAGPFAGIDVLTSKAAKPFTKLPGFSQLQHDVIGAFNHGFGNVLYVSMGLLILGAIAAFVLIKEPNSNTDINHQ
ncbi:MAG: MFS transporter [Lactobacillaceae bacterium]|jgi:EmrB/QacA subfamily drug resistance transporter|nr:MFS transporter [Lactobacillaceae bacterium]